jgi:Tos1-like cell wall protein
VSILRAVFSARSTSLVMRLRRPARARSVLGVVTASLVVGLAACGTTGPGAAATSGGGNGGAAQSSSDAGPGSGSGGSISSGLGPAQLDPGDLDPPSDGATITFEEIGATGWYPSRRDPATGPCDAFDNNGCCMAKKDITDNQLTPWDEDLVMTLRGPILVKQLAVYHPLSNNPDQWELVSGWDSQKAALTSGITFDGKATPTATFAGAIGSECIVEASSATPFICGAGSLPYCPAPPAEKYEIPGLHILRSLIALATSPVGR